MIVVPSFAFAPMFVLLAVFGGAGNEVLDYVETETYWRIAGIEASAESLIPYATGEIGTPDTEKLESLIRDLGSPEFVIRQRASVALADAGEEARAFLEEAQGSGDPEIATAAAKILALPKAGARRNRLHRLMAIRTLGEIKAETAIPHLEELTKSKQPFVPGYANRALARIRGLEYRQLPPDPLTFEKDLAIAYPSVAAVVHARSEPRDGGALITERIESATALMRMLPAFGLEIPTGDSEDLHERLTREHLGVFQRIGNVRIDSFTAVIPSNYTPDDGGLIVIVRGLCDHRNSKKFMDEEFPKIGPAGDGEKSGTIDIEGIEWMHRLVGGADFYIHFPPEGELLIFVGGTHSMEYLKSVSKRLIGGDKSPASGPGIEMLGKIPKDSPGFFAGELSKEVLAGDLAGFSAGHGSLQKNGDDTIELRVRLKGNEKTVSQVVASFQVWSGIISGGLQQLAQEEPQLSGFAKAADSIRATGEGATLHLKAQYQTGLPFSLAAGLLGSWIEPKIPVK